MSNADTNIAKVSKADCYIKLRQNDGCSEQYCICYDWKERDTKESGTFIGTFEIEFSEDVKNDEYTYPTGKLIMPIRDTLYIVIED